MWQRGIRGMRTRTFFSVDLSTEELLFQISFGIAKYPKIRQSTIE
jgi:hypothetical protein